MLKRLLLVVVMALLGAGIACAGAATAARPSNDAVRWAQFDGLVAGAKKAMMTDPQSALAAARSAAALAQGERMSARQQEAVATGLWLESEALTRTNQSAEARTVLDRAIRIAATDRKVTELDGELALSLARAARVGGDLALSLKSFQKAYDIFAGLGMARDQSMALQGLGVIYEQARDLPDAIGYFSQAAEIAPAEPSLQLSIANNLGLAFQHAGRYRDSLDQYSKALAVANSMDSGFLQARILTNIAFVETKLHELRAAQAAANRALKLLGKTDENGWAPFIFGIEAQVDFERGAMSSATADLDRAFAGTDLRETTALYRDTHEIAYRIYSALGAYPLALAHLEAFKRLDDEDRSLAASANLALMNARFEFANQKLEIERLKTERLQREASLRESRAATQNLGLVMLILAALAVIVWISWQHRLVRRHRDEISKANVELKKILGERDNEIGLRTETEAHLRVAMEEAEQANRAKTKFLANMSHELRTPLNAIIGFSEIIATGALPAAKAQEYSADINASGRKLLGILADILDTARLDAGSVCLSESKVSLSHCVEQVLARVAGQCVLGDKQVLVTVSRDIMVRADGQRLTQILEKLVFNAAKYTGPQGLIEIGCERVATGGIDITVADDGVGIPPEQLEHIMERFGQIESPYARSYGGIGLGLPIAKSLVTLHGGTLTIASQPDKGTVVRVHLPAERDLSVADSSNRQRTAAA